MWLRPLILAFALAGCAHKNGTTAMADRESTESRDESTGSGDESTGSGDESTASGGESTASSGGSEAAFDGTRDRDRMLDREGMYGHGVRYEALNDGQITAVLATTAQAQVSTVKAALPKLKNPDVRRFAEAVVADHTKIAQLARARITADPAASETLNGLEHRSHGGQPKAAQDGAARPDGAGAHHDGGATGSGAHGTGSGVHGTGSGAHGTDSGAYGTGSGDPARESAATRDRADRTWTGDSDRTGQADEPAKVGAANSPGGATGPEAEQTGGRSGQAPDARQPQGGRVGATAPGQPTDRPVPGGGVPGGAPDHGGLDHVRGEVATFDPNMPAGPEMERAFMASMVVEHERILSLLDMMAPQAQAPALTQILQDVRPKLQQHLDDARRIESSLGTTSVGMRGAPVDLD